MDGVRAYKILMAPSINQQIESHVQTFVTEISSLVRVAALEAVRTALGGESAARRGRPVGSGRKPAKATEPARRGRPARRSPEQVEALASKFLTYVKANDGKRIDEAAKDMGVAVDDLKKSAQLLLGSKAVRRSGERRGTKYHAVGAGGAASSGGANAATPAARKMRAKKA